MSPSSRAAIACTRREFSTGLVIFEAPTLQPEIQQRWFLLFLSFFFASGKKYTTAQRRSTRTADNFKKNKIAGRVADFSEVKRSSERSPQPHPTPRGPHQRSRPLCSQLGNSTRPEPRAPTNHCQPSTDPYATCFWTPQRKKTPHRGRPNDMTPAKASRSPTHP